MQPDDVRRSVATLRLGAWPEVRRLLRPRLVPPDRAGPLHRPIPRPAGRPAATTGPSPPVWDLGIDVPGGIARIDRDLRDSWPPDDRALWSAAVANLAHLPMPRLTGVRVGAVDLAVAADGPWTTGWLLHPAGPAGRPDVDLAVVWSPSSSCWPAPIPAGGRRPGPSGPRPLGASPPASERGSPDRATGPRRSRWSGPRGSLSLLVGFWNDGSRCSPSGCATDDAHRRPVHRADLPAGGRALVRAQRGAEPRRRQRLPPPQGRPLPAGGRHLVAREPGQPAAAQDDVVRRLGDRPPRRPRRPRCSAAAAWCRSWPAPPATRSPTGSRPRRRPCRSIRPARSPSGPRPQPTAPR